MASWNIWPRRNPTDSEIEEWARLSEALSHAAPGENGDIWVRNLEKDGGYSSKEKICTMPYG